MIRVASREVDGAPHETLLILDATTGQNGLVQARQFLEVAGVNGIVITQTGRHGQGRDRGGRSQGTGHSHTVCWRGGRFGRYASVLP